jgi:hypothetical protein
MDEEYAGGCPVTVTPVRRRGSIRRTTSHDSSRPDGLEGPVFHAARGRDLLTPEDGGAPMVADAARIDATIRYMQGMILSIAADPPAPALDSMIGKGAFSGFRRLVEAALPGEAASHSVRFQLLDEMPVAVLANGRVLRRAGIGIKMGGGSAHPVDICAGWAAGGTLVSGLTDLGPPLTVGPDSPVMRRADDPLAWHDMVPLPPHSTRRQRRIDLWEADGTAWVDAFFRDSNVDGAGVETVVHEWTITAEIDPRARRFVSAVARSGPLPYPECPASGASAGRLAGMAIDGLRRDVRSTFTGPSTCTHLNDSFRALEDAGALLDRLRAGR